MWWLTEFFERKIAHASVVSVLSSSTDLYAARQHLGPISFTLQVTELLSRIFNFLLVSTDTLSLLLSLSVCLSVCLSVSLSLSLPPSLSLSLTLSLSLSLSLSPLSFSLSSCHQQRLSRFSFGVELTSIRVWVFHTSTTFPSSASLSLKYSGKTQQKAWPVQNDCLAFNLEWGAE